jgi:hypothetical protein
MDAPPQPESPTYSGLLEKWLPDPPKPSVLPPQADPCAFVQLPQNPAGGGYYNYGTPGGGAAQYGLPDTTSLIQDIGKQWPGSPFGVGNISLADGGKFGHRSHIDGSNVDIRPMRTDGGRAGTNWRSPTYDQAATQQLVNALLASGRVRSILFNDPGIRGVRPWPGHNDHLHVNVRSQCLKR